MNTTFLTGSYAGRGEGGVSRVTFDPAAGFAVEGTMAGLANPSYVLCHPNGKIFYAVEETDDGAVRACRWGEPLPEPFATGGASPCHLALSADGSRLYAANYSGGSLAAFALDAQGNLLGRTDLMQHAGHGPNAARQEAAHVHFSMEIDGVLHVCDLGADAIVLYGTAGGRLRETGRVAMPAGSGPRHLARDPRRPEWLYCVGELDGRVHALRRGRDGYAVAQSVSALPEGYAGANTAAAIRLTGDGALLLVSNRGHDSIAVFPVDGGGTLGAPVISPVVREPRDFIVRGEWVLAASQRDSVVRAYRLDRKTLRLEATDMALETHCPVCLCVIE